MIFFDLDDTLYDQMAPFKKAYEQVFVEEKYQTIDLIELFEHRQKYSIEAYTLFTQGELTKLEMFSYRLCRSFEAMDVKITDEQALAFQEAYQGFQGKIELDQEMVKVLDYCTANAIPIGILSNGEEQHQWKKIKHLNLEKWFTKENIFVSGAIGFDKPDRRIFEHVRTCMQLEEHELCLIGDNFENDVVGASGAGWQTVFLNKYRLDTTDLTQPNVEITKSKELLPLIDEIVTFDKVIMTW
ncbi:HAD family hydrolase [Vagococcus zengguangii]|uniref:HAD family hydrolase n=1 Tax=Vagococcus zengguangii TaxID=2571750 RepID=A0A4D7CTU3_9ENTE|nr:HAD family hydrolase [Vagococcus zengguangii]QCI86362.1 HAD family hydrolase [Vagococcus zengguangii]TLG81395.1 HAD family hydrolase [Vagococcus zengguangii]